MTAVRLLYVVGYLLVTGALLCYHGLERAHPAPSFGAPHVIVESDPRPLRLQSWSRVPVSAWMEVFVRKARAQSGEDISAVTKYAKFCRKRGGTIVESGALDGLQYSTSFAFEIALGWSSVHIEASPVNYEKLRRNRPSSRNIHAALCSRPRRFTWSMQARWVAFGSLCLPRSSARFTRMPRRMRLSAPQYSADHCIPCSMKSASASPISGFWMSKVPS